MSDQPQPPKRSRRRWILILVGLILLLTICGRPMGLFLRGFMSGMTDDPLPTTTTAELDDNQPATESPTATPRPIATTPADPETALRAAVEDALGDSNRDLNDKMTLFQVRPDERSISVTWVADDHFTTGMIGSLIQSDAAAVLNAIIDGDVPFDWVFMSATIPLTDGGEADVFTASFTAESLRGAGRINPLDVLDLAENYYLHPDLK